MDYQIGRMMTFLDKYDRRVSKDTLVIYTTDHGSMLFDHGLADKHNFHTVKFPNLNDQQSQNNICYFVAQTSIFVDFGERCFFVQ